MPRLGFQKLDMIYYDSRREQFWYLLQSMWVIVIQKGWEYFPKETKPSMKI